MSDEGEQEEEELAQADWPVKGPATPQQALVAITMLKHNPHDRISLLCPKRRNADSEPRYAWRCRWR